MEQRKELIGKILEFNSEENDTVWIANCPVAFEEKRHSLVLKVPFQAQNVIGNRISEDKSKKQRIYDLIVRVYDDIVRITLNFDNRKLTEYESCMFDFHDSIKAKTLKVSVSDGIWDIIDSDHQVRMRLNVKAIDWSGKLDIPPQMVVAEIYPDHKKSINFMSYDTFQPNEVNSIPLGFVERNDEISRCLFGIESTADEKFVGTGERFRKMDLSGSTILLENDDAMGANCCHSYKNVPFYISSKGYGLLAMTPGHCCLSFKDTSSRAVQGVVKDSVLDLFIIGGENSERINYNYRRLTGFPSEVPLWSYGMWMGRMSYHNRTEVESVAERLREKEFPCDVLHIDTGWFEKNWVCDWEFGKENFPEPEKFFEKLGKLDYKVSLWQTPYITIKIITDKKNFKWAINNFL